MASARANRWVRTLATVATIDPATGIETLTEYPSPAPLKASLTVRARYEDEPAVVPADQWEFTDATGKTVVENAGYTAHASRITYSQEKEMLVLEGQGKNDARLYRQERIGAKAAEVVAQKILFWPKTNSVKSEGARFLVSDMHPGDLALPTNGIGNAVEAVADNAEDPFDAGRGEDLRELISDRFCHAEPSPLGPSEVGM